MERMHWGGWECARFVCDDLEMIITLDVGPRIISFGFLGGPNELMVKDKDLGQRGGDAYRGYGGHRLWIAPEDRVRTYTPDNTPVVISRGTHGDRFATEPDRFGIVRSIEVSSVQERRSFRLNHRVTNASNAPVELAPWSLTVMAVGGTCLIPQEPFVSHEDELLPARPLVLWPYAKMNDVRYTWGERLIQLRQDTSMPPTKIGALVKCGVVGYANGDRLFLKQFDYDPAGKYPDYGVNFETFTRHDMLEVESLGTLQTLNPGESAELMESWTLFRANLDLKDEFATHETLMHLAAQAFRA